MAADTPTFAKRFPKQPGKAERYKVLIQSIHGDRQNIAIKGWLPEEVTFDISSQYEAPFSQGLNQMVPGFGQMARAFGVNLVTQAMTSQVWQGSSEINISIPLIFQAETNAYLDVIKPIKDLLKLTMPKDLAIGGLLEAPGPHIDIDKLRASIGEVVQNTVPGPQQTTVEATKSFFSSLSQDITGAFSAGGKMISAVQNPLVVIPQLVVEGTLGARDAANVGAVKLSTALINAIEDNISLYIGDFLYIPSVVITDVSQAYNVMIAPDGNPSRATVNVTFKMFYIPTQADLDTMFSAGSDTGEALASRDLEGSDWATGNVG